MILLALAVLAADPGHHAHYDSSDVTDYEIRVHEEEQELPEGSEAREDLHEKLTTLETTPEQDTRSIHNAIDAVRDSVIDHELDCDGCREKPEPEHDADDDPEK